MLHIFHKRFFLSVILISGFLLCSSQAHARIYAQGAGRFVQRDPIGPDIAPNPVRGSSPSIGLYTYATSRPHYTASGAADNPFESVGTDLSYYAGGSPTGNLYAYVLNRPLHYVDPYGEAPAFSINTVSASAGPCGRVEYYVSFGLNSPSPKGGVFIQHVRIQIEVKDCSGTVTSSFDRSYYESWEVRAGSGTPTLSGTTPSGHTYNDGFTAPDRGNCTKGYAKWRGKIRFFEDKHTPGGWRPGGVPQSGILPSSPNPPDFWSFFDTIFATRHTATHEWDCCPTPQSQSFSHNP